ncbi:abhydrolase domain-containing protein 2 [Biomphalaria pfeifferi]|uniref:Abhydrolase domain-containing protein 2 n=1 Tax=Biomphalaria pfeifferi TaxID=112525 RepID=A0AAD8B9K0_BIOPF|nr:abhydrolase domain-containing protein 2 [Biomphalaria pfeifferi]
MSPLLAAVFALLLYLLVRLLHITTPASAPLIYAKDRSSQFVQSVLTLCPILQQPYFPPLLWGKSGHVQTVLYAKMGRVNVPVPNGIRHSILLADGATLTFDLHKPKVPHKKSYCLLICPGIGNNSESHYMRTLVDYAQKNGYIAVVLNHIGSHKTIPLTAARIFTYGGTEELHLVRKEVEKLLPESNIILVGCSMGGNIVVKYLGENREHQEGILAAVQNSVSALPKVKNSVFALPKVKNSVFALPKVKNSVFALPKVNNSVLALPKVKNSVFALPKVKNSVFALPKVNNSVLALPKVKNSVFALPKVKNSVFAISKVKNSVLALPKVKNSVFALPKVH